MTSSGDGRYQVWHHRLYRGDGARAHPCLRPIADLTQRTPFFCQEDFHYDTEGEVYLCPRGKELRLDRPHSPERSLRYRARAKECNHCPLKAQGTTSTQGRTLCRSVDEEYLDRVRGYHETEAYKKLYRKRSVWVEPLFAEGKDWHGMQRFRLRRLWRVNSEALTRAAGQNLTRLIKQRGWGLRPFPTEAVSVLFLASCAWVTRLFWGIGLFLADELRLSHEHGGGRSFLPISFERAFFITLML